MKFTDSHEWIESEAADSVRLGITTYAQKELGDIVYIELPSVGKRVNAKQELVVLESTKAAVDVYSPVTGMITEVNHRLKETPELVNQSPEQEGWICKIHLTDPAELDRLMDRVEYERMLNGS